MRCGFLLIHPRRASKHRVKSPLILENFHFRRVHFFPKTTIQRKFYRKQIPTLGLRMLINGLEQDKRIINTLGVHTCVGLRGHRAGWEQNY